MTHNCLGYILCIKIYTKWYKKERAEKHLQTPTPEVDGLQQQKIVFWSWFSYTDVPNKVGGKNTEFIFPYLFLGRRNLDLIKKSKGKRSSKGMK